MILSKLTAISTLSAKPRNMLIITIIVMPLFVVENLEAYLAGSIVDFSTSASGLAIYILIFAGYLVLQYFAINFIKQNSMPLKSRSKIIEKLQRIVFFAQYALTINLVLILAQMFIVGRYSVAS